MTKLLYALAFLTCLPAFGQSKLSISATVTPAYRHSSYGRYSLYPDSDGQIVEPVHLNGQMWSAGYSGGLTFRYTYAPGWSVGAGLWYYQTAIRQTGLTALGEGTTTVRNRAVRLPLLLNFQSSTKRLSPYFSLGLLLDFPVTSRVIVDRSGQDIQRLRLQTDGGPVFHALLGAGASYQLGRRYSLIVQPTWAYSLGRFGGADSNVPAYELSLQTQVAYSF